jgi:hypothetical protein
VTKGKPNVINNNLWYLECERTYREEQGTTGRRPVVWGTKMIKLGRSPPKGVINGATLAQECRECGEWSVRLYLLTAVAAFKTHQTVEAPTVSNHTMHMESESMALRNVPRNSEDARLMGAQVEMTY